MAMQFTPEHVTACRAQFPALAREVNGQPAIYLDGPAGSQVPQGVIDAMGDYLAHRNANHGGEFTTSRESDVALDSAHAALAGLAPVGVVAYKPINSHGGCKAGGAAPPNANEGLVRRLRLSAAPSVPETPAGSLNRPTC